MANITYQLRAGVSGYTGGVIRVDDTRAYDVGAALTAGSGTITAPDTDAALLAALDAYAPLQRTGSTSSPPTPPPPPQTMRRLRLGRGSDPAETVLQAARDTDPFNRFELSVDGVMKTGDGTAAPSPVSAGSGGRAFQANTNYKAGDVINQLGALNAAKVDFTSAATFNQADWTPLPALPATSTDGAVALYDATSGGYIAQRQNADPANDSVIFVSPKKGDDTAGDGASWGRAYKTIQKAVDTRTNGRTFEIGGSTDVELLHLNQPDITLRGRGTNASRGTVIQAAGATALLSGAMTAGAITQIPLTSMPANMPTTGVARIGNELFTWTGKSGNNLTGASRAQYGTTATTHAANDAVAWTTVLTAPVAVTDTTLTFESTAMLPTPTASAPARVRIGLEVIQYTAKTATTVTGCTRGMDATPALAHATGDMVTDASILILIDAINVRLEHILTSGQANFTGDHIREASGSNVQYVKVAHVNPSNTSMFSTPLTPYGGRGLVTYSGEGRVVQSWRATECALGMHLGHEGSCGTYIDLGWSNCRQDVLNDGAAWGDLTSTIGAAGVADGTVTTIPVVATTAVALDILTGYGTATIEGEMIAFTGFTATSLTGCIRGLNGTTAAAHAAGVPVAYRSGLTGGGHNIIRAKAVAANQSMTANVVGAVDASQTSITLTTTLGMIAPGHVKIDNEIVVYGNIVGNQLTNCRRLYNATTHADGAGVLASACFDWRGSDTRFSFADFDEGAAISRNYSVIAGTGNNTFRFTGAPQNNTFITGNYNHLAQSSFAGSIAPACVVTGTKNVFTEHIGSLEDHGTNTEFVNPRTPPTYFNSTYQRPLYRNQQRRRPRTLGRWYGHNFAEGADAATAKFAGGSANGFLTPLLVGERAGWDQIGIWLTAAAIGTHDGRAAIYELDSRTLLPSLLLYDLGAANKLVNGTATPLGASIVTFASELVTTSDWLGMLFWVPAGNITNAATYRTLTERTPGALPYGAAGVDVGAVGGGLYPCYDMGGAGAGLSADTLVQNATTPYVSQAPGIRLHRSS